MQKNKQMQKNKRQNVKNVRIVIRQTVTGYAGLSLGIVLAVAGAIVTALLPPWILGSIVDTITAGNAVPVALVILYFAFTVLTGLTESLREGLLTVFGQKITHALRSSMMEKYTNLTAGELTKQEPGTIVSRFVGDVDTVENLFTSGIISMFADACKIISILVVIWLKNRGLAIVLLVLVPFLYWFTRTVQKNMLKAQIENRRAVGRASGHVPETLHNIRTIHTLGKERYMEQRYDEYITESYRAVALRNILIIPLLHVALFSQRMNGADVVKGLRHMTGSSAHSTTVLDLGFQHVFLHRPGEPIQKWHQDQKYDCQSSVFQPDHHQDAYNFAGIGKHTDDSRSEQILHCVHISHEPGYDRTGLLLRQFPCRQVRVFLHHAAPQCMRDLLTEDRKQTFPKAFGQPGEHRKGKI